MPREEAARRLGTLSSRRIKQGVGGEEGEEGREEGLEGGYFSRSDFQ